jgi:dipeptidyl-peptidase-4
MKTCRSIRRWWGWGGLLAVAFLGRASAAEREIPRESAPGPNAAPQARRTGPGAAEHGIYRARVTPHWLANSAQFWYRNDLPGGAREFILVDAERGSRERAFDHPAVAKQIGAAPEAPLPVEELQFSEDGKVVTLINATNRWRLERHTGKLTAAPVAVARPDGLAAETQLRPSLRNGTETQISFHNQRDEVVEIFWIDDQGERQRYGEVAARGRREQHTYGGHIWLVADERGENLAVFEATDRPGVAIIRAGRPPAVAPEKGNPEDQRRARRSPQSPDGTWTAFVKEHNVFVRPTAGGAEFQLSQDGKADDAYTQIQWAPDSQSLVAWRVEPGERKEVYLLESAPAGGGRAKLTTRPYALPGDKFSRHELNIFDVARRRQLKPAVERFEHEWERPQLRWAGDGRQFFYAQAERGHQRFRVIAVAGATGAVRNLVDEKTETFIWTTHIEMLGLKLVNWLTNSDEMIYVSEQDGWRHLYLVDAPAGGIKHQITKGEWVVRGIDRIDEARRQIWFHAGGRNADQDPYFLHYYRINFDGSDLVALTAGNGHHSVQYSPDGRFLIDTWSRVDAPPVHELRRTADGKLVCRLEAADIAELQTSGWEAPEVFVARGRDGTTDIWGIISRPRDFDPKKKYPVIEYIYAGPQGAYVPKSFSGRRLFSALTDRGFVVVQMDGMGTAFRSKAFHDVCWKNLKDAGFPDRILWHQAVAAKYPWYDMSRVGIYGTSAGGQNAAGAVLFHPEFYRAAVANCGCHDNRMDKASWNEQWMGYPVGPHYAACSNVAQAHRLQGGLFLIVGELDSNVPPESTLRVADALIKANKEFELLVVPGENHGTRGAASAYVERRQQDFFGRQLSGSSSADGSK